jgi:hypothetical protein
MTAQTARISTPRLLAGPAVLVVAAIALTAVGILMGAAGDSSWPMSAAVAGLVTAGALLAWRAGAGWARWVAWGIAVLLFSLSAVFLLVGIWASDYYGAPAADLPGLIGLPIAGLLGSALTFWTVLRPPSR